MSEADEVQKAIDKADAIHARLAAAISAVAAARRAYYGAEKGTASRDPLTAAETEAQAIADEFSAALSDAQRLSGIPEEVFEAIEGSEVHGDSEDRTARSALLQTRIAPSDFHEDVLPAALANLKGIVDGDWLARWRENGGHKLGAAFLKEPLNLVRGVRVESEFPPIHRFAQALLVCEDYLANAESYDFYAGALLVPQTAALGNRLPYLRRVAGDTEARIARLWQGPSDEVDATVFELLVAGAGAAKGQRLEFLSPGVEKTPDLRVHDYACPTVVECKRKRVLSDYEREEARAMRQLFDELHSRAVRAGLWGTFELSLNREIDESAYQPIVDACIQQRLAPKPSKPTEYDWGTIAYRAQGRRVGGLRTRLYSPLLLEGVFGWSSDMPSHDGIVCKVLSPEAMWIERAEEPVALMWTNTSETAIRKRAWSPMDVFGDATGQIPMGEVGFIYVAFQEGTREWIADRRTTNLRTRMEKWGHSAGIRLPVAFLVRLYPRPLGHGEPDLVESTMTFVSDLYGTPEFLAHFPGTVFSKLDR